MEQPTTDYNIQINDNGIDTIRYEQVFCPICGSSELAFPAIVSFKMNSEGAFYIDAFDYTDIHHSLTNVNQEVVCTDDGCGNPFDPYINEVINLDINQDVEQQFLTAYENYVQAVSTADPEEDIQPLDFSAWKSTLEYNNWSGVYGDLVNAHGVTMLVVSHTERNG